MAPAADGHCHRNRRAARSRRAVQAPPDRPAMPAAVIRRLPRGDDGSGHKLFLANRLLLDIVKARQTVGDGLEFGGGREI
jgi:hypothetical protein